MEPLIKQLCIKLYGDMTEIHAHQLSFSIPFADVNDILYGIAGNRSWYTPGAVLKEAIDELTN